MELQTKANSVMSDEKVVISRRSFDDYHKEKSNLGIAFSKKRAIMRRQAECGLFYY